MGRGVAQPARRDWPPASQCNPAVANPPLPNATAKLEFAAAARRWAELLAPVSARRLRDFGVDC